MMMVTAAIMTVLLVQGKCWNGLGIKLWLWKNIFSDGIKNYCIKQGGKYGYF